MAANSLPSSGTNMRGRITRSLRTLAPALVVLAYIFTTVALVVRAQPVSSFPRLVLAVGATFVPLIALSALLLAVLCRQLLLSIIGVCLLVATIAIQVSWYYIGRPSDIGPFTEIRVLSSNIRLGLADESEFVSLAKAGADVITVVELTPGAIRRFSDAGIDAAFPYSRLLPQPTHGIGIWSRYPLIPVTALRHRNVQLPAARLKIPGLKYDPLLASAYVYSPVAGDENTVDEWRHGMAGAKAQLDNFATAAGPAAVIVGGDYNSTPDMREFRELLTNGYDDAVNQIGAGFAPTFKADSWLPPLITIDHILTRNATASSIKTVTIKGTDHRALLATVRVPLDPTTLR